MMKNVLFIVILFPHMLAPASLHLDPGISNFDWVSSAEHQSQSPKPIVTIGAFSNMRYTSEHAYGYKVELWREQNHIFGFFLASQGLQGDTPTGLLEEIKFNPRTGQLAFRARLTTSLFSNRDFHMVPSRDIFQFSGVLKGDRMIGILEIANALTPAEAPRRQEVKLKRSQSESEVLIEAQSYDDWKRQAERILQLGGPKW